MVRRRVVRADSRRSLLDQRRRSGSSRGQDSDREI